MAFREINTDYGDYPYSPKDTIMFGKTQTKTLNATAVMELNERNVEFLKKIQMNHPIPEDAKYIAFLEDGDCCFLESLDRRDLGFRLLLPEMHLVTYFADIPIEFTE
jgi:hypothetical protein